MWVKKEDLLMLFDYSINTIIKPNLQKSFLDITILIKEKVNQLKFGDYSSILSSKFSIDDDPVKFINNKFLVFDQKNYSSNDRKKLKLLLVN